MKQRNETNMATEATASGAEPTGGSKPGGPKPGLAATSKSALGSPSRDGFFTIRKRGQGYWTRMGTAAAAMLILALSALFVFQQARVWLLPVFSDGTPAGAAAAGITARNVAIGLAVAVVLGGALIAWRVMNRPSSVDFLVATDTEMKKVNWTSRAELIGSTKVVIFFMLLLALILFSIDIAAGYFFQFITLLKTSPL